MENVIAESYDAIVFVLVCVTIIAIASAAIDWALERRIDEFHLNGRPIFIGHLSWGVIAGLTLPLYWLQQVIRSQEPNIGPATAMLLLLVGAFGLLIVASLQLIAYAWRLRKLKLFFRRGQPERQQT